MAFSAEGLLAELTILEWDQMFGAFAQDPERAPRGHTSPSEPAAAPISAAIKVASTTSCGPQIG